jgi:hypothetical protein
MRSTNAIARRSRFEETRAAKDNRSRERDLWQDCERGQEKSYHVGDMIRYTNLDFYISLCLCLCQPKVCEGGGGLRKKRPTQTQTHKHWVMCLVMGACLCVCVCAFV